MLGRYIAAMQRAIQAVLQFSANRSRTLPETLELELRTVFSFVAAGYPILISISRPEARSHAARTLEKLLRCSFLQVCGATCSKQWFDDKQTMSAKGNA